MATYLKLSGVAGSSKDRGRAAWSDLEGFSFGSPKTTPKAGTSISQTKPSTMLLHRRLDRTSIDLAWSTQIGRFHDEAIVEVVGSKGPVFTATMSKVLVTAIRAASALETVELTYDKIRFTRPGSSPGLDDQIPAAWELTGASAADP